MNTKRFVSIGVLVMAILGGLWSVQPVVVQAGGGCTTGCCNYTVDCGSPQYVRCCLPQSGEAGCEESCPNYCKLLTEGGCGGA